jgi:DNA-binding HxlR family transcriptional regulator
MKADGSDFDRLLLDQIADRWSILVLGAICASGGILRFNALRRQVSGVSQKTLTQCVRRLERNGCQRSPIESHSGSPIWSHCGSVTGPHPRR